MSLNQKQMPGICGGRNSVPWTVGLSYMLEAMQAKLRDVGIGLRDVRVQLNTP